MDVNLVQYPTRESWLAVRQQSIGASESAALFGIAPPGRESAYSLWAKKAGIYESNGHSDSTESLLTWGLKLEDAIAQGYAERTGHKIWTPPTPYCVATHPKLPFLTATIDRWIIYAPDRPGTGDLELKNVSLFSPDWREDGAFTVPLHVQCQVQHQLAVTGLLWGAVAALVAGNRLEVVPIERNNEFIEMLEEKASEFWRKVQTLEPPELDSTPATSKVLKSLHPDDNGVEVEWPDEYKAIVDIYEAAKLREGEAKAEAELAANQLRQILGPNTWGILRDGRRVSLKTVERAAHEVKASKGRTLRIERPKRKD